jgi:adenylate kinase
MLLNVVILGAPGSGKGTQSDFIISKYGLYHISTGDILRKEIKKQTELGKIAEGIINEGCLVPDDLIINLLSHILDENPQAKGYIFDGFPRTVAQADALENLLRGKGSSVLATLNLDVEEKELVERLLKRGKEQGRLDDNLEVIQNRLKVYHNQTEPLKDYYKKRGKLFSIRGNNCIEDVFEHITEVLDTLFFQKNK